MIHEFDYAMIKLRKIVNLIIQHKILFFINPKRERERGEKFFLKIGGEEEGFKKKCEYKFHKFSLFFSRFDLITF